jgi:hypothetical protein
MFCDHYNDTPRDFGPKTFDIHGVIPLAFISNPATYRLHLTPITFTCA